MGTDIHFEGEFRNGPCAKWEHISLGIEGRRNYMAFALLAGVRNYYGIVPIAEPRGHDGFWSAPTAAGFGFGSYDGREHRYGWDGGDYHGRSWLTLAEIQAYPWDAPQRQPIENYLKSDERNWADAEIKDNWVYKVLLPTMARLAAERFIKPEDVRIVFCFDS